MKAEPQGPAFFNPTKKDLPTTDRSWFQVYLLQEPHCFYKWGEPLRIGPMEITIPGRERPGIAPPYSLMYLNDRLILAR